MKIKGEGRYRGFETFPSPHILLGEYRREFLKYFIYKYFFIFKYIV